MCVYVGATALPFNAGQDASAQEPLPSNATQDDPAQEPKDEVTNAAVGAVLSLSLGASSVTFSTSAITPIAGLGMSIPALVPSPALVLGPRTFGAPLTPLRDLKVF